MGASPHAAPRLSFGAALALLTLLAALLRLAGLGSESYWFDEIWSVKQSRVAFGDVLASLRTEDVHPPLWPALLHLWIRVFGEGEAAVRLLPALVGVAAVPLFGAAMARLEGALTGLVAAALLAVHPYAVEFSQEARSYALLLALTAGLLWLTVAWRQRVDRPAWPLAAGWAVVAGLLLYTHVFGALVDLALGVALLLAPGHPAERRPPVLAVVAAGAAAILAYLPWVPAQLQQVGRVQEGFWIAPLTWTDPVRWLWHWSGYSIVLLVITVPAVAVGLRAAGRPLRRLAGLVVLALVGIPGAASLVLEPFFQPKYAIGVVLVLTGAVAAALGSGADRPWRRWASAVAVVALGSFTVASVHMTTAKEQYRELAALGAADRAAGAALVTEARMAPYVGYYLAQPPGDAATLCAEPHPARVTLLLAHPVASDVGEGAIAACCRRLEDVPLVLARAVRYACP